MRVKLTRKGLELVYSKAKINRNVAAREMDCIEDCEIALMRSTQDESKDVQRSTTRRSKILPSVCLLRRLLGLRATTSLSSSPIRTTPSPTGNL